MTYLSDRRKNRTQYWKYIVGFVLLAVVVYAWPSLRVKVYPAFDSLLFGYGSTKHSLVIVPESVRSYFTSRAALLAQDEAFQANIERLENELAEKNAIIEEQKLLAGSGAPANTSTIMMYPVMQDITHIYDTIVLSKGFKDGIEKGALVYVRGRQPVCTITEVYTKTSLCVLLSSTGTITEGVTAPFGTSTLALTLKGDGGGSFVADVPRDTSLFIGDTVLLRSDESMTLGTIVNVIKDNQATSWHVYVRGAYNPVTSSVFYTSK